MSETEKITVNLSVVDLGQVDLLVEQGFYSSRSDCIRTAIRNHLNTHAEVVKQAVVRKQLVIGIVLLTRKGLESRRKAGEKLDIRTVGMVSIAEDVTLELAQDTIQSLKVYGVLRASQEMKLALADRIK